MEEPIKDKKAPEAKQPKKVQIAEDGTYLVEVYKPYGGGQREMKGTRAKMYVNRNMGKIIK